MEQSPGRNDPCPCGSGKKYKKCCLRGDLEQRRAEDPRPGLAQRETRPGDIYYLPGAADTGYGCWPSISCYRKAEAGRQDELVWAMVHQRRDYDDRKKGLRAAEAELEVAFTTPAAASHEAMAEHLGKQGFTTAGDFHVAPDWNTSRAEVLGDQHEEPIGDAAIRSDPQLHAMIMQTIDNQLADNDPPETRQTLKRLMDEGYPQELCRRLIGLVVAIELSEELLLKRPFNRERFIANLAKLPEPPETSLHDAS